MERPAEKTRHYQTKPVTIDVAAFRKRTYDEMPPEKRTQLQAKRTQREKKRHYQTNPMESWTTRGRERNYEKMPAEKRTRFEAEQRPLACGSGHSTIDIRQSTISPAPSPSSAASAQCHVLTLTKKTYSQNEPI